MEGRVGRDFWWGPSFSIGVIRGADESGLLTFFHGCKSLIPSLDDSSLSEVKLEWTLGISIGIKLTSVFEGSFVKGKDLLSFGGEVTRTLPVDNFPKLSWNYFNHVLISSFLRSWYFSGGVLHLFDDSLK